MNWFGTGFRKIHILHVSPEWAQRRGEAFDARQWAEQFKAARVEAVELYAKDHHGICYYQSTLGLPYPRDVLGELLEETNRAGIKLMAYFSVGYDAYALGVHPDWMTLAADGTPFQYGPFFHACLNTPYREYALSQIDEITRQYAVAGLWLDIVSFLFRTPEHTARHLLAPCYCIHCRRQYRDHFGRPVPLQPTPAEAREAYAWQIGNVRSFLDAAYRIARSYRGDQVITYNGAGGPGDPMNTADLTSIEAHAPDYSRQSFIARWSRSRGKPFEVLTPGGLPGARGGWDSWDQKPANALAIEAATVLAQGGSQVFGVAPYPDGSIDAAQLDALGQVFARIEPLESRVLGATSVAQVAILLNAKPLTAPRLWSAATASAYAWHSALLAGHVLFDVVGDIEAATRYGVVILPDSIPLTDADAAALDAYVQAGGKLIVTGRTGLLAADGIPRAESALAATLGISYRATSEHVFAYVTAKGGRIAEGIPEVPILVNRQPVEVALAGAEALADLVLPETAMSIPTTVLWGYPPPHYPQRLPGVTSHARGRGVGVYITWPLEARGFGNIWSRQLAINTVSMLVARRWLTTDAPPGVEVVLNRLPDRHVLHLIDHRTGDPDFGLPTATRTPAGMEVVLAPDVVSATTARVLPGEQTLAMERTPLGLSLRLPAFESHLVVELLP